jgi:hypothetical protein
MQVHKTRAVISEDHRLTVELPSDFPPGDAEVTVLTAGTATSSTKKPSLSVWLDDILTRIPATAVPSQEALRRESIYEDD